MIACTFFAGEESDQRPVECSASWEWHEGTLDQSERLLDSSTLRNAKQRADSRQPRVAAPNVELSLSFSR